MNRLIAAAPTRRLLFAALLATPLLTLSIQTQAAPPQAQMAQAQMAQVPAGGVSLLPSDAEQLLKSFLPSYDEPRFQVVDVQGQPFARALRLRTEKQTEFSWNDQIGAPTIAPVKKGDVLLATFRMRAIQTQAGYGRTNLIFEDAKTFNKSTFYSASASPVWKTFSVPFVAAQDEAAGAGRVNCSTRRFPATL